MAHLVVEHRPDPTTCRWFIKLARHVHPARPNVTRRQYSLLRTTRPRHDVRVQFDAIRKKLLTKTKPDCVEKLVATSYSTSSAWLDGRWTTKQKLYLTQNPHERSLHVVVFKINEEESTDEISELIEADSAISPHNEEISAETDLGRAYFTVC